MTDMSEDVLQPPENPISDPAGAGSNGAKDTSTLAWRVAWQGSPERSFAIKVWWLLAVAGIGGCIAIWIGLYFRSPKDERIGAYVSSSLLTALLLALTLMVAGFVWLGRRRAFGERFAWEKLQADLDLDTDGDTSFENLWRRNQTRLDYYHRLATTQSAVSFNMALAAVLTGFLVLLGASWAAASADTTSGAVAAGSVGALGAALSAYIAATLIRMQETSVRQSETYFVQPVDFFRFLTAERLARELDGEMKDESMALIVRAIVGPWLPKSD